MNNTKSALDLPARLDAARQVLPAELRQPSVLTLLELSLAEDLAPQGLEGLEGEPALCDVTSAATLPPGSLLDGRIFAKAAGVIAGLPLAQAVFAFIDPGIIFSAEAADGERVQPGKVLARLHGPGASLLAGERTALNFLGRLSGVATLAHQFVQAIAGTGAAILDTRKTTPGFRLLEKYAVRMGGAQNHRMGLHDMVLVKNNHIDGAGSLQAAVQQVRQMHGARYLIEVEVRDLDELQSALALSPDRILLDNMTLETMRRAVQLAAGRVPLEASGNVRLDTVRAIAETGVDYISSGSITHSAPVLDISLHVGR